MKRVVLVSGAPGSGKTTLAVPLAAELSLPLLSKDIIKEQLFDTLGVGDGDALSWSRSLGAASMELIWTLARYFPEAVLEANFRPHSSYERSRVLELSDRVVKVNCVVSTRDRVEAILGPGPERRAPSHPRPARSP